MSQTLIKARFWENVVQRRSFTPIDGGACPESTHGGKIDAVPGVFPKVLPLLPTALLLASCSIDVFAKTSAAPQPPVCRSIPSLNKLTVTRTNSFPQNHLRFMFPADVTISDQTQVQDVAKALCALPLAPSRDMTNCPADLGLAYELTFSDKNKYFPAVSIEATGCQSVYDLVKGQWAISSPRFWRILGAAMGITGSNNSTFRGQGGSG